MSKRRTRERFTTRFREAVYTNARKILADLDGECDSCRVMARTALTLAGVDKTTLMAHVLVSELEAGVGE